MNLYELMKAWFEFAAENDKFRSSHTALFFFCVDLNNRLAWIEVFGLPTYETATYLGMSPNTFRKVFDDLINENIIKLVKKSKNQFTANQISMGEAYQNLLKLSKSKYKAFVKAQLKQASKQCAINIHTYNSTLEHNNIITKENKGLKEENEKLKKEIEKLKKGKPKTELSFDFMNEYNLNGDLEKFKNLFQEYLDFRKELKKPLKTQKGVSGAFKNLMKLSSRNYQSAKLIIEQSISNEWQGLFELKGTIHTKPINNPNKKYEVSTSIADDPDRMEW